MGEKPARIPLFNFDILLNILNWALFAGSIVLLFVLKDRSSASRFWLPYIAGVSFISAFTFSLFGAKLVEKIPKTLLVFPILSAIALLMTYKFFGGLASPLFILFFVFFVLVSLSHYYAGLLIAASGVADTMFALIGGGVTPFLAFSSVAAYSALAVVSIVYGRRLSKLTSQSTRASYLAERLTQEKSKEENLLSSMADAVYTVDTERRIVMFNKAAENLTSLATQDVLDLHCFDVLRFHDDKGENFCAKGNCPIVESWNKNASVVRDNIYFTNAQKKTISLAYSGAPIRDFQGNITGGIAVFRDVTKKKEVERMRNEFVSIASHEMRTPLFAIEGYLSLAKKIGEQEAHTKTSEYIDKARGSVISMSNLLKNLLSFSKIEEGKLQVNAQDFEINQTIRESIDELVPKALTKNIVLDFRQSTTGEFGKKAILGSYKVHADESMIKEVLLNLIDNAIKFTQRGKVEVTVGDAADFVKVCVKDSGPGIAKEDQGRLFQKFYRVDNTFTRTVGGTGLGLYLSREMVELAGGKIWIESELGHGAMFCFTVPRVKR